MKLSTLFERNAEFVRTGAEARRNVPELPFLPWQHAYVITCIDPRTDPAAFLGVGLGDAIVARTVGGRANRSFLDDLAWISYLHETLTPDDEWFELVVVHHTDCGSALMADAELRRGFVDRGFDDAVLRSTAVTDPATTVRADVDTILATLTVSPSIRVSGWTYDVRTGHLTEVVKASQRP
jgi:carbonic anhydrase